MITEPLMKEDIWRIIKDMFQVTHDVSFYLSLLFSKQQEQMMHHVLHA